MSIREFTESYKQRGFPRNVHEWTGKVIVTDVSASSLIYVDGCYTVEEYFLFPACNVPLHSHPCDTITIFLGGSFFGFSIAGSGSGSKKYSAADYGSIGGILTAGDKHGAVIGQGGAVSLVVAEWKDLAQRNSAAIEWYGEPSGPMHQALLHQQSLERIETNDRLTGQQ
jgi:hypothetical protein